MVVKCFGKAGILSRFSLPAVCVCLHLHSAKTEWCDSHEFTHLCSFFFCFVEDVFRPGSRQPSTSYRWINELVCVPNFFSSAVSSINIITFFWCYFCFLSSFFFLAHNAKPVQCVCCRLVAWFVKCIWKRAGAGRGLWERRAELRKEDVRELHLREILRMKVTFTQWWWMKFSKRLLPAFNGQEFWFWKRKVNPSTAKKPSIIFYIFWQAIRDLTGTPFSLADFFHFDWGLV